MPNMREHKLRGQRGIIMGHPPPFELGKTLGNIEGHLESIDNRLETGEKVMEELSKEQKKITECNSRMKKDIEKNNGRLYTHDEKFKTFDVHILDDGRHFDKKKLAETKLKYWAKKKFLTIILVAVSAIVAAITGIAIAWINLGGP